MTHIYIAERNCERRAYTTEAIARRHEETLLDKELDWVEFTGTSYGLDKKTYKIMLKIHEVKIII